MILAAAVLSSCSKILEQTPSDRYTDAQVWNDEFLINSHLANLYAMSAFMINDAVATYGNSPVNVDFSSSANWSWNLGVSAQGEGPIHSITIADECKYSERGAQANYTSLKKYGFQSNTTTLRWWSNGYYLNRQLNHVIANIEGSPVSNAKSLKAEARFLRAFNYFAMVKRYGGVPLILKEVAIDAPEEDMYPARNTEKECYDFIIDELLDIADDLEVKPAAGKAGKGAALTLASRAALYAGCIQKYGTVALDGLNGIPAGGDRNYFQIAADAAKRVMTECGYSLYAGNADKVQNLRDIFLVKDNSEAIMVKRHEGNAESTYRWSWDICCCPKPNAWSVGQYLLPYYDFVEEFDNVDGTSGKIDHSVLTSKAWTMDELFGNKDPRFHAWFWTNGSTWPGSNGGKVFGDNKIAMYQGINLNGSKPDMEKNIPAYNATEKAYLGVMYWGDQMNEFQDLSNHCTGFGVRKYLDEGANNMTWFIYSTTDYQIFRYAEVLLNYAEACVELGKGGEALDAFNQIRSRAGMPAASSLDLETVRHEREVELCFENHRYWDLRRWRTAKSEINCDHQGIRFVLDWEAYQAGTPKFWVMLKDKIDDPQLTPAFPENNYYMPICDKTVALNKNLKENPGY